MQHVQGFAAVRVAHLQVAAGVAPQVAGGPAKRGAPHPRRDPGGDELAPDRRHKHAAAVVGALFGLAANGVVVAAARLAAGRQHFGHRGALGRAHRRPQVPVGEGRQAVEPAHGVAPGDGQAGEHDRHAVGDHRRAAEPVEVELGLPRFPARRAVPQEHFDVRAAHDGPHDPLRGAAEGRGADQRDQLLLDALVLVDAQLAEALLEVDLDERLAVPAQGRGGRRRGRRCRGGGAVRCKSMHVMQKCATCTRHFC